MARRRGRRRPRRDHDEYVEEYYYEEEPGFPWRVVIGVVLFLFVVGGIWSLFSRQPSRRGSRYISQGTRAQQSSPQVDLQPVKIGNPKINLKAVEDALWKTKTDNPKDHKAWMKKFEDEVNAIYFATLKQASPNADPTTLMKKPLRVDSKQEAGLLHIYGYLDNNNTPGYQNEGDSLIFAFKQTRPYTKGSKQLSYSLRDGRGYYYREPGYAHTVPVAYNPIFMGFFLYPTLWYTPYYRTSFVWWGTPYYRTGFFYNRYSYYYGSGYYRGYYGYYRSSYYRRHRPWGWSRGSYYRRGRGGSYYSRGSRYRSRGSSGSRYRSRGSSGSRYRSRGSSGSRYRSRGGKW